MRLLPVKTRVTAETARILAAMAAEMLQISRA
jgi:hypothetical protein